MPPISNWPSAPMLNNPARKPSATPSAGKRHWRRRGQRLGNGADRADRTGEKRPRNDCPIVAGSTPVASMIRPPSTSAIRTARTGTRYDLFDIVARDGGAPEQLRLDRVRRARLAHAALSRLATPAMARPISLTLAVPAWNSSTIRPRNITRMRSESARISSSSVETMSTPTPASRAAMICACGYTRSNRHRRRASAGRRSSV